MLFSFNTHGQTRRDHSLLFYIFLNLFSYNFGSLFLSIKGFYTPLAHRTFTLFISNNLCLYCRSLLLLLLLFLLPCIFFWFALHMCNLLSPALNLRLFAFENSIYSKASLQRSNEWVSLFCVIAEWTKKVSNNVSIVLVVWYEFICVFMCVCVHFSYNQIEILYTFCILFSFY